MAKKTRKPTSEELSVQMLQEAIRNQRMLITGQWKAASRQRRDYFAGLAMQGMLADPTLQPEKTNEFSDFTKTCAMAAVKYADALIAELDKPTPA